MLLALNGDRPDVHPDAWVAATAVLVGRVRLGDRASVWHNATIRAEFEDIIVGERSNIQDGCVLHVDPGFPLTVGDGVSVGHNAVLHGCSIGDNVLVGMGAVVLNGATVGRDCLIAAGALVPQGMRIPPNSMVAGVPGKVRRELTADEVAHLRANAELYLDLARQHATATAVG